VFKVVSNPKIRECTETEMCGTHTSDNNDSYLVACNAVQLGTEVLPKSFLLLFQITRLHIRECDILHSHRHEKVDSHIVKLHGGQYSAVRVTEEKGLLGRDYWIEKILWLA
jgi:flavoprotein